MKIRFLKNHVNNKAGDEIEEDNAAAHYLIRVGVAEEVQGAKVYIEKPEFTPVKEKKENKTGNVPTAERSSKKTKK